jgi:protein AaeX
MFAEVDVLGAFVPGILAWGVVSLAVFVAANALFTRLDFYRFVWHPPLVRFSLFVIVFCGIGLMLTAR